MLAYGARRVDAYSAGSSAAAAAAYQVPVRRLPHSAVEIPMPPRDVVNRRMRFSLQSERRRTEVILVADCCGGGERRGGIWMPAAVGDCTAVSDLEEEENGGGDAVVEVEVELELDDVASGTSRDRTAEVMIAAGVTVVLGVGNRVLYKLALVPLKQYPFFLAQLATFGYVFVYFSIFYLRYKAGIITNEMLSLPKAPYVAVGLFEALAAASGMAAGAMLPGAAITILSQSFLVWQLLLSYVFLGRRYRFNQLLGCFLVATGVIVTVTSGSSAGSLIHGGTFWSLLMIVSFLLQAADTVLKEIIFLSAARQLKGGSVDLFVVNSHGSAFQALFICLLLPFLSNLWGIPFSQLPSYLKDGAGCFLNNGVANGCNGAPLLPLLFVLVNMGFNISLLHLLKISSAVYSCLASTISVPISVFLFTLPLPYLGVGSSLPPGFLAGAVVLVLGMLIYTWTPSSTTTRNSTLSEPLSLMNIFSLSSSIRMALPIAGLSVPGDGGGGGAGGVLHRGYVGTNPLCYSSHNHRLSSPLPNSSYSLPISVRHIRLIAAAKKLSSRTGKFDSKNKRSLTTTTEDEKEEEQKFGQIDTENIVIDESIDYGFVVPDLPGEAPDFWEGPQWDGLGFFVQYLWAFGIVFALVACGIAVSTYNEGATDFKDTASYQESIQSREILEEGEEQDGSGVEVFESNPTEDAPILE